MPYPGNFHRLVVVGRHYGDQFNFGLSIVPSGLGEIDMVPPGELVTEAVADAVATWFSGAFPTAGPGISNRAVLDSIKLNRIGPDGRYTESDTNEWIYPGGVQGAGSVSFPPQTAMAVTLRTRLRRGRGSRGRFYLPPCSPMVTIDTSGRITATAAESLAEQGAALIRSLNSVYDLVGRVGVASDAGTGVFEHVERVSVGRVIDTIRSRRSALEEDYQDVDI